MMTPDQLTAKQRIAQSLMEPDYSPVQSPWQGVARAAGNIVGALQERKLDKVAAALAKHQMDQGAAVQAGTPGAVEAALIDPSASEGVRDFAKMEWERAHPKPSTAQPYRFRDNSGNLQELGPDGKAHVLFVDPTPKYYIQGDQAVAIPNMFASGTANAGSLGMVAPAAPPPSSAAPPASLPANFAFADDSSNGTGGAPRNAAGGFPSR